MSQYKVKKKRKNTRNLCVDYWEPVCV